MSASMPEQSVRERIEAHTWWHTIEIAPGVTTPGGWDLRPTAARIPWPSSLAGLRCLDVGTMDGFWAFEMQRRGAAEVVAIDIPTTRDQDHLFDKPSRQGAFHPHDERGEKFRLAASLLQSRAEYRHVNVYDMPQANLGMFDLVFVGYITELIKNPLAALEAIRSVCRGWVIVLDRTSPYLSLLPLPLAEINPRKGYAEWFVFNRMGLRHAVEISGFDVDAATSILRDTAGPGYTPGEMPPIRRVCQALKHRFGVLGRSIVVRGHVREPAGRRP